MMQYLREQDGFMSVSQFVNGVYKKWWNSFREHLEKYELDAEKLTRPTVQKVVELIASDPVLFALPFRYHPLKLKILETGLEMIKMFHLENMIPDVISRLKEGIRNSKCAGSSGGRDGHDDDDDDEDDDYENEEVDDDDDDKESANREQLRGESVTKDRKYLGQGRGSFTARREDLSHSDERIVSLLHEIDQHNRLNKIASDASFQRPNEEPGSPSSSDSNGTSTDWSGKPPPALRIPSNTTGLIGDGGASESSLITSHDQDMDGGDRGSSSSPTSFSSKDSLSPGHTLASSLGSSSISPSSVNLDFHDILAKWRELTQGWFDSFEHVTGEELRASESQRDPKGEEPSNQTSERRLPFAYTYARDNYEKRIDIFTLEEYSCLRYYLKPLFWRVCKNWPVEWVLRRYCPADLYHSDMEEMIQKHHVFPVSALPPRDQQWFCQELVIAEEQYPDTDHPESHIKQPLAEKIRFRGPQLGFTPPPESSSPSPSVSVPVCVLEQVVMSSSSINLSTLLEWLREGVNAKEMPCPPVLNMIPDRLFLMTKQSTPPPPPLSSSSSSQRLANANRGSRVHPNKTLTRTDTPASSPGSQVNAPSTKKEFVPESGVCWGDLDVDEYDEEDQEEGEGAGELEKKSDDLKEERADN